MVLINMKALYKYALEECGGLCVIAFGLNLMVGLCVDNWDMLQQVRSDRIAILAAMEVYMYMELQYIHVNTCNVCKL